MANRRFRADAAHARTAASVSGVMLLALVGPTLVGCAPDRSAAVDPMMYRPPDARQALTAPADAAETSKPPAAPDPRYASSGAVLPADLNTARTAAKIIATLPLVEDVATQREIALRAALYGAAAQLSGEEALGDATVQHWLIPPTDADGRALTTTAGGIALPIARRTMALRTLAAARDLGDRTAWAPAEAADDHAEPAAIRRGSGPAAWLRVAVLARSPDGRQVDAELAADRQWPGAGVRTIRQRVEARWDGEAWRIEPAGVRIES